MNYIQAVGPQIKIFRKQKGLTQEALAEALGVTVSAVSKWERGQTLPDLPTLLEIAQFFQISLDVLFKYEVKSLSIKDWEKEIKQLINKQEFQGAIDYSHLMLQRFPNDFQVLYVSAGLFRLVGMKEDQKYLQEAIDLFNQCLNLINQCRDPHINEYTIKAQLARTMASLDQVDQAIGLLKTIDFNDSQADTIGLLLAKKDQKNQADIDEGLDYLSKSLLVIFDRFMTSVFALQEFYSCDLIKDYTKALEIIVIYVDLIDSFMTTPINFFSRVKAMFLLEKAKIYLLMEEATQAQATMQDLLDLARTFDQAPDYSMEGLKFIQAGQDYVGFDPADQLLEKGMEESIEELMVHQTIKDDLLKIWQQLREEKYE